MRKENHLNVQPIDFYKDLYIHLKEELVPNGLYEQAFPCHDARDILHTNCSVYWNSFSIIQGNESCKLFG